MMFENKVLNTTQPLSISQILEIMGEEKCRNINTVDLEIRDVAKRIILNYNKISDLLFFLQSAIARKEYKALYQLHPPHTVAKADAECLFNIFFQIGILNDVFYSQTNNAYLLQLNPDSAVSINRLLTIGCAECLLQKNHGIVEVFYQEKAVLLYKKTVIEKYSLELAAGLDYNVASTTEQMKSLIKKISRHNENNIHHLYIVTDHVKSVLPMWDNIVSISELLCP